MQIFRLHTVKNASSILLMLFLLLPSVVNFIHSTESHSHNEHCKNKSETHIHEKELDCCLCDITLLNDCVFNVPKEFSFINYQKFPESTIHVQTIYPIVYLASTSRGPPFTC